MGKFRSSHFALRKWLTTLCVPVLLLLCNCSFSSVRASSADTLRVLELLQQARSPSVNSILGFVHDSTLSAQALELAERIGWERGIFKGHLWCLLSITDRGYRSRDEVWEEHLRGARAGLGWASAEETFLLYRAVGRLNAMMRKPDAAARSIDTAQWAAERSGNKRLLALVTYTRAHALRSAERWGEAFKLALAANAMAEELDDDLLKATTYNLSGFIRGRLGDLDGAMKDLQVSVVLADSMGIDGVRMRNRSNWGYMMQVKGR